MENVAAVGRQFSSLRQRVASHRRLFGTFAFELIIVFVGVTLTFALENYRDAQQEASYPHAMLGGLRESLGDFATHVADIDRIFDFLDSSPEDDQLVRNVFRALYWEHIEQLAQEDPDLMAALGKMFADHCRKRSFDFNIAMSSRRKPSSSTIWGERA
jgi:hypothetical protein